jgi:ketosteroid isomerase-like protein
MSQENVELVRSQYELFARRDFQGMLEYVDPGVEITEPPEIPGAESFSGHAGYIAAIEHWAGEFEDFRVDVERLIDAGDTVISYVRQQARGKQSGLPVEVHVANAFTFGNGRLVRWQMFATLDEALDAVGLSE